MDYNNLEQFLNYLVSKTETKMESINLINDSRLIDFILKIILKNKNKFFNTTINYDLYDSFVNVLIKYLKLGREALPKIYKFLGGK